MSKKSIFQNLKISTFQNYVFNVFSFLIVWSLRWYNFHFLVPGIVLHRFVPMFGREGRARNQGGAPPSHRHNLWCIFGTFFVNLLVHIWYILGIFLVHCWYMFGTFVVHFLHMFGTFVCTFFVHLWYIGWYIL